MIRPAVVVILFAAGCGREIELGRFATDASTPIDAPDAPFTAGAATLRFLDPSMAACDGSLAGQEPMFEVLTTSSERLLNGAVVLAMPDLTTLAITGDPITSALAQSTVMLVPNTTGGPPGLWDAVVTGNFGSGPASTDRIAIDLALDQTTAHAPGGIRGQLSLAFETTDTTGTCSVAFGVLVTHP